MEEIKLEDLTFGIVGYGRMGKKVEKVLKERGLKIAAIVDASFSKNKVSDGGILISKELSALKSVDVDTAICFTSPGAGDEVTRAIMEMGIDQAIATTKFYMNPDQITENTELLEEYDQLAKQNNCRVIYAANFSIGMNSMWQFLGPISKTMEAAGYDVAVEERHHKGKGDISGSAKKIARIIIANGYNGRVAKYNDFEQEREPNEITVTTTRCGLIPGTHTVIFDSPTDTFEITHTVRDPLVFPKAAIDSAVWLKGQKPGLYGIEDRVNG